jgi:pentatricopeptide repeat protein
MNGHILNQIIKVYASAIIVPGTTNEHIDQYCDDAWLLYTQLRDKPECEITIQVLNSLLILYGNALKPQELESKVLPEYQVNRIEYDANTYSHLMKLFLNIRDLDKVIELYRKSQDAEIKPVYR